MTAAGTAPAAARLPWGLVGAASAAVVVLYGAIFSVPPLIPVFVDEIGLTHTTAGALMSVLLLAYAVGSLLAGALADRLGAVRVVAAGLLLGGIASIAFSLTTNVALFLPVRAAIGLAAAFVYIPGLAFVLAALPAARRNLGASIYLSSPPLGITAAFAAAPLVEGALGWEWPFRIWGAACLGALAVWLALTASVRPRTGKASAPTWPALGPLFGNRGLLTVSVGLFAASFVSYGVFTWVPPFFSEVAGLSERAAGIVSTALGLIAVLATLAAGWATDRTGRPVLVAAAGFALASAIALLALVGEGDYAAAAPIAVVVAFGISAAIAQLFSLPALVVSASRAASATGLGTAAAMSGGILSTYLGGYIVTETDSYDLAFILFAATAALAGIAAAPLAARGLAGSPR